MKKVCLISGGWDSAACFFIIKNANNLHKYDYYFINYNQKYLNNEYLSAKTLLNEHNLILKTLNLPLVHDQERRNFFFISEIKRLGYESIVLGSRNLIPLFDQFRDSNWLSLKLYAYLMNIKIELPITGWSKRRIVHFVQTHYSGLFYNCYLNENDFRSCNCTNCVELKSILIKNTQ